MVQLNNFLKEYGFIEEEEIIMEFIYLIDRYQILLRQLCEIDEDNKLFFVEDQSFKDFVYDVICWIIGIKEFFMVLNLFEGKMIFEERI